MRLGGRTRHDRLLAGTDHDARLADAVRADDAVERRLRAHRDRGIDEAGVDILAALHALVEILQHVTRHRDLFGGALQPDLVPPRGDIDAKAVFERDEVLVVLAEELDQQLRLVEQQFDAAAVTGLGGDGLTAHAILSKVRLR